ncbi:MAG: polyphosphate kinase 1 [Butyricicoccus pullicaecorum]|nr:polyphosphate kinase 1 [Butyricicoccus pullicaecorum]
MSKKEKKKQRILSHDISYTQNRELSWLQFNRRVLEEAEDPSVPLFERLKFVSIFTSNLNEFFMIRVGSLTDIAAIISEDLPDNKSGWTAAEQLEHIFKICGPLAKRRDKVFAAIEEDLNSAGVQRLRRKDLNAAQKRFVEQWYRTAAKPILSPQVIDQHHPFPHIPNGRLHLLVRLRFDDRILLGLLPIPPSLPPFVRLPGDGLRYILTEDVLLGKLSNLFPGFHIQSKAVIKVTRNADISPDDDAFDMDLDFRAHMQKLLKKRNLLAPVRLEYQGRLPSAALHQLCVRLGLDADQVYSCSAPLNLDYVFALESMLPQISGLSYEPWTPQPSPMVDDSKPILPQVQAHDVLLHYPFESMSPFLHMIREAARDPKTISIKITIYRVARKSKLISYLCEAAENGKDVTVLVELRARFDEQNNIDWAERLEESGCKVIYGLEGLKVHSKICLITRTGEQGIEQITQIGTGNYNEKTAALYTDLSFITADPVIGEDAAAFFNAIALGIAPMNSHALLISPHIFKPAVLHLIDGEISKAQAGKPSRIVMKFNSLTDRDLIDRLSAASCAGVPIDLIIRGICCLTPGIKGKTENIRVRSIVGRFLEHSRILCFGTAEDERVYIGSADLMTRNTEKRVEVACPVTDPAAITRIHEILDLALRDNTKARIHDAHGDLRKPEDSEPPVDCQAALMQRALEHAAEHE